MGTMDVKRYKRKITHTYTHYANEENGPSYIMLYDHGLGLSIARREAKVSQRARAALGRKEVPFLLSCSPEFLPNLSSGIWWHKDLVRHCTQWAFQCLQVDRSQQENWIKLHMFIRNIDILCYDLLTINKVTKYHFNCSFAFRQALIRQPAVWEVRNVILSLL